MVLSTNELQRVATVMNSLRPDWNPRSLYTLLARDHAHRPYRDLVVAAAWVAADEHTKTPARLAEFGPWWQATADGEAQAEPDRLPRDRRCFFCAHDPERCTGPYDRTHEFVAYATELERINGPEAQERIAQAKARARAAISKPTTIPPKEK